LKREKGKGKKKTVKKNKTVQRQMWRFEVYLVSANRIVLYFGNVPSLPLINRHSFFYIK
jgi:hypothetical protein